MRFFVKGGREVVLYISIYQHVMHVLFDHIWAWVCMKEWIQVFASCPSTYFWLWLDSQHNRFGISKMTLMSESMFSCIPFVPSWVQFVSIAPTSGKIVGYHLTFLTTIFLTLQMKLNCDAMRCIVCSLNFGKGNIFWGRMPWGMDGWSIFGSFWRKKFAGFAGFACFCCCFFLHCGPPLPPMQIFSRSQSWRSMTQTLGNNFIYLFN